jgi:hypothetical protein
MSDFHRQPDINEWDRQKGQILKVKASSRKQEMVVLSVATIHSD